MQSLGILESAVARTDALFAWGCFCQGTVLPLRIVVRYLTISEYARHKNVSRQAIADRIDRGTLELVTVKEDVQRIAVDESEFEDVK